MGSPVSSYPDWKAPAQDGELLIWPDAATLCRQTLENHKSLSAAAAGIQNLPLAELRSEVRRWLGHDDARPLLVDGHQTELYHPGVWVKRVLANIAADKVGGSALHLAVDTDAPKHLSLRWPGGSMAITDDPATTSAHWSGLLESPTPAHLAQIERAVASASTSLVARFLESLRRLTLEQVQLSPAITNAAHELDWELGLRHHALLASPVWASRGFLVFAHHLVARAREFASRYNAALAAYRKANKIRTATRPMPDLAVSDASIELPFWLDELSSGDRKRPRVTPAGDGFALALGGAGEFLFDPSAAGHGAAERLGEFLTRRRLRLSPRALTLTMFVRLCVADQFIHGIGGARYDQVTDRIIAEFFKLPPPHFAVTTATMFLPEAAERRQVCVQCIEIEGHRLRHALLGDAKQGYLQRIEAAPRRSAARYEAFAQMHRELAGVRMTHPAVAQWESRLSQAREKEAEESALFDRELFYALQPVERLEAMIDAYRRRFA